MKKFAFATIVFLFVLQPLMADRTVVHCGQLIDGVSDQMAGPTTLLIEDGRIVAVEEGFTEPAAGDKVIDLRNRYVMPGLLDMHVHLGNETRRGGYIRRFRLYDADFALIATKYLRRTLMAGFTTVRNPGGTATVDIPLRNAVNRGDIIGPRMFVAGKTLAVLGGHSDPTNSYREDILGVPGPEEGIVTGVESARRAALLAIKRGADLIKITATAGVLSQAGRGQTPQFTEEEIRTIVQTAKDFGLKVTAHAHGAEGMKRAIRAGVASIEHGTYMDEEAAQMFKDYGAYLVPTVIAGKTVAELAKIEGYYSPLVVPKALRIGPLIQDTFARAYKAGVPIAFGTDAGVFQHGKNAKEFEYMVEAGMPPMKAIQSATYHGAKLVGQLDNVGTLEAGKYADVIAVDSNPLEDIRVLQNVTFVMKEGVVYKNGSDADEEPVTSGK